MKRIALLLALAALTTGCPAHVPPSAPAPIAGATPSAKRDVYVLLLILDGGRADTVYQAVDDGMLPNLKNYIFDRGVRVKDAIAVFPSVTTSGHQSFITGLLPGHSGITGLDWFDRPLAGAAASSSAGAGSSPSIGKWVQVQIRPFFLLALC